MLLKEIYYQRNRHLLTILTLILSLTMIIIVDTVSYNLQASLNEQIETMGLDISYLTIYDNSIKEDIYNKILKQTSRMIKYRSTYFDGIELVGIDGDLLDLFQIEYHGRLIHKTDYLTNDNVVVLGKRALKYFDYPKINETIYINQLPFTVIGIIDDARDNIMIDFDSIMYVPLDYINESYIESFYFCSEKKIQLDDISTEAYLLIEQSTTKQAFGLVVSFIGKLLRFLSFFSFMIASIGMINNALSSLKSRIKEIAIKRTLGASQKEIYLYFLIENMVIILIGITVSLLLSISLLKLLDQSIVIYIKKLTGKVAFIIIYSLITGSISAIKASKISISAAIKS